MRTSKRKTDLLPGTLDMLVLKTLQRGSMHGYGIVRRILTVTDQVLLVEEGSLYPALHRIEKRGFIRSKWGRTENNRRAKYYELTKKGRTELTKQIRTWERVNTAIVRVLAGRPEGATR